MFRRAFAEFDDDESCISFSPGNGDRPDAIAVPLPATGVLRWLWRAWPARPRRAKPRTAGFAYFATLKGLR